MTMNNNSRVFIIGVSGFIGRYLNILLNESGYNVFGTYFQNCTEKEFIPLDVRNEQQFLEILDKVQPDVIIHCAALTNVKQCEEDKHTAHHINVEAPVFIARYCRDYGTRMIFISSDLVFSGENPPYTENDTTDPLSYYGYTKAKAEEKLLTFPNVAIIRTSLNIGLESPFVQWVLRKYLQGETVPLFIDEYRNAIYAADFARRIVSLLTQKPKHRIYHIAASDSMNRYDWGVMFFRHIGLENSISSLQEARGEAFSLNRPGDITLDTFLYEDEFDTQLFTVEDNLQLFIERERGALDNILQGEKK